MKSIVFIILLFPLILLGQGNKSVLFLNKYQKGTQLDGTSQYWSNANPANLNMNGYQILMMAWVKQSSTSGSQQIVSKYKSATNGRSIMIDIENGTPFIYVSADGNGNANRSSTAVSVVGKWMFIAGTYTPSALDIYVNGDLRNSTLTGSIPSSLFDPSTTPLCIGVNGTLAGNYFAGQIGEVQLVRFSTLDPNIANIISQAYSSRLFKSAYNGGEIIFWTKWNGGGIDLSGKSNHLTPAASPAITNVKY